MHRLFALLIAALPGAGALHAQSTVSPWKLEATRDSFVVNIQGRPLGFTVLAVEVLAEGGFRVTEKTRIGPMVDQQTEIMLDGKQRITSVVHSGTVRGQPTRIDLRYHPGHVQGSAAMPGQNGPVTHHVDAKVPEDVIDDNLVQILLPTLPWSDQAHWTLPVFSGGKNALTSMELVANGSELLPHAGSTIDAYRAELRGGDSTINVWVSKARPHRLLKLAVQGAPMEFVRAN